MITLDELTQHCKELEVLLTGNALTDEEREALEVASSMMQALVIQLENQAVSFTP